MNDLTEDRVNSFEAIAGSENKVERHIRRLIPRHAALSRLQLSPVMVRAGQERQVLLLALFVGRKRGVGIDDLASAHTTRAALMGLRKRGYAIERERSGKGGSIYHIVTGTAAEAWASIFRSSCTTAPPLVSTDVAPRTRQDRRRGEDRVVPAREGPPQIGCHKGLDQVEGLDQVYARWRPLGWPWGTMRGVSGRSNARSLGYNRRRTHHFATYRLGTGRTWHVS
jgi:hypothetical protein